MLYVHLRKNRISELEGTLALVPPTKEHLHQMFLSHSNRMMFNMGVAIKHPDDKFCKKTGREVAASKMAPIALSFNHVVVEKLSHAYYFSGKIATNKRNYNIHITLITSAEKNDVKLISAELDRTFE